MTLHAYFALKYTKFMITTFSIMSLLLILIDLIEHSRRFSYFTDVIGIIHLTFLNAPKSIYEIIDLIMLIASIIFFVSMSKTNELVIVRGAGRSVYGAILSPILVSGVFGLLFLAIFNPLVATTSKSYLNIKEVYIKGEKAAFSIGAEGLWLRQGDDLEQSVIRASRTNYDGSVLYDVTIISFSENGSAIRRVTAEQAIILDKNWHLNNVKIWPLNSDLSSEKNAVLKDKLVISSNLTKDEIRERISDPSSISIWNLRSHIAQLKGAGFSVIVAPQTNEKISIEETLIELNSNLRGWMINLGIQSLEEVTRRNLRAMDYDTAAISGLRLIGYDRPLPMWLGN